MFVTVMFSACSGTSTTAESASIAVQQQNQLTVLGQPLIVPDGADRELFALLADKLEQQLLSQGGKGVTDVTGEYVDPLDVTSVADDARLEWTYNNRGDYDLNGLVTVSDLTPIGVHFGKDAAAADWAAASCADGNANSLIEVGDITPIGQNFNSSVTNYVVEADILGDDTWVPVANIPQSNGGPGGDSDWLTYSELITNGAYAQYFRVYAGPEASPLVPIEIDPTAFWVNLTAAPTSGTEPLHVTFDVHIDNGTPPYAIHLSFGDGDVYDDTAPSIGHYEVEHTFLAGPWTAVVAVTDNTSEEKTDDVGISVEVWEGDNPLMNPGFWVTTEMEPGEDFGNHSAIALVDGRPMMVYTDDSSKEVKVGISQVAKPESLSDWNQYVLDDGDNRGGTVDIAEVQGVPCIVYEDTLNQDIWFAAGHHPNPGGPWDWWIHEPDALGFSEPQVAALDDGGEEDPILVYRTAGAVRFARSLVDGGLPQTGGTEPPDGEWQVLDVATGVQYEFPRIAVFGGFPAIAYQEKDAGDAQLMYGQATSVTPDTLGDWTFYSVDNEQTNSGLGIVLTAVDGLPAIGYRDIYIVDYLKYAWADNANPGPSDWHTVMVRDQDETHVGMYLGMVGYDKLPIFSYINVSTQPSPGLEISYPTTDPPVSHAFDDAVIDPADGYFINGQTNMMLLDDGTPVILYRTSDGLKFSYFEEIAL